VKTSLHCEISVQSGDYLYRGIAARCRGAHAEIFFQEFSGERMHVAERLKPRKLK
jgi:hypothetical protein